jgi:hypothetical protein
VLYQHRLDTPAPPRPSPQGTSGRGTKKTLSHSECS